MRLEWGSAGKRFYETGVDRGVLYVGSNPGVPWSGLTSVSESSSGGETKAYYVDGVKYAQRQTFEEYEADIEAFTYPDEFGVCDGTVAIANGLFATRQRRKPFGFCYRSLVGNDVHGVDLGYKIHLVYDALAAPSTRNRQTMSNEEQPFNFSWHITTKAPLLNFRPTAHFVIDSRTTPQGLLSFIEDVLYGSSESEARLPSAAELTFLFTSFEMNLLDAGDPGDIVYYTYDGGAPVANHTETIDGGTL